nr:MAG TPA: hypothetical protein [Caudoviricetes sp.]
MIRARFISDGGSVNPIEHLFDCMILIMHQILDNRNSDVLRSSQIMIVSLIRREWVSARGRGV